MPLEFADGRQVDENPVPWLEVELHLSADGELRHLGRQQHAGDHVRLSAALQPTVNHHQFAARKHGAGQSKEHPEGGAVEDQEDESGAVQDVTPVEYL